MTTTAPASRVRWFAAGAALLLTASAGAVSTISDDDFSAPLTEVSVRSSLRSRHARPDASVSSAFNKVFVIVLENEDYAQAAAQPFLQKLMARGSTLTNYHGIGHPSQPNYVAMIAGGPMGVRGDGKVDLSGSQVGDLLEAKGLPWAAYAEGYPGDCFLGSSSGDYARKHMPFLSFTNVQNDPARCARVKAAPALDADLAAGGLPAYSMYVPDMIHDGHDSDVATADAWLSGFLGPKLEDPSFMSGLLVVVTFDEGSSSSDNRVLTILLGDGVAPGGTSEARYDHVSLLKTIENGLGLGDLGRGDASAAPIEGVWRNPPPVLADAR